MKTLVNVRRSVYGKNRIRQNVSGRAFHVNKTIYFPFENHHFYYSILSKDASLKDENLNGLTMHDLINLHSILETVIKSEEGGES